MTVSFNWGSSDGFPGAVAEGVWVMKMNSKTVARFDLAASSPLDEDEKPTIYIPSVKIEVGSDNYIDNILIKAKITEASQRQRFIGAV